MNSLAYGIIEERPPADRGSQIHTSQKSYKIYSIILRFFFEHVIHMQAIVRTFNRGQESRTNLPLGLKFPAPQIGTS